MNKEMAEERDRAVIQQLAAQDDATTIELVGRLLGHHQYGRPGDGVSLSHSGTRNVLRRWIRNGWAERVEVDARERMVVTLTRAAKEHFELQQPV